MPNVEIPEVLDSRYHLTRILGEGGMAAVYLAWDGRLRAWRAIKILLPSAAAQPGVRERFGTEAQAMAKLDHPHVVRAYDVIETGPLPYIVMELVDGGSLDHWITQHGAMPPRMALDVILQVCEGVAAAHAEGIIHRDVKPHNILVDQSGTCKVTDFGIARLEDSAVQTRTGMVMGTLGFMAPEQRLDTKAVDQRADVYAVAATMISLLVGQKKLDDVFSLETDELVGLGIPRALAPILHRATRYRRDQRHPNVNALTADLLGIREELPPDTSGLSLVTQEPIRHTRPPEVTNPSGAALAPAPVYVIEDAPAPLDPPRRRQPPGRRTAVERPPTHPKVGGVASRMSPGQQYGDLVISRLIGRGGMAGVYLVWDKAYQGWEALKVLEVDRPALRVRMEREGRVQAEIDHPNVVQVLDLREIDDHLALVLEFVNGPSLDLVKESLILSIEEIDDLANGLFDGLTAAHDHGLVHRDIKPHNILLKIDGAHVTPKLADFGIVKDLEESSGATWTGMGFGTPDYISPEQLKNAKSVDARADLFSLGVVLYELIAGERPFRGDDVLQVMQQIGSGAHRPLSELVPDAPPRIVRTIEALLQTDRDRRPKSAAAAKKLWFGEEKWRPAQWDVPSLLALVEPLPPIPGEEPEPVEKAAPKLPVRPARAPVRFGVLGLVTVLGAALMWSLLAAHFALGDETPEQVALHVAIPWVLWVSWIFTAFAAAMRWPGTAAAWAVPGLYWLACVTSGIIAEDPPTGKTLRIASANVLSSNPSPEKIRDAIMEKEPDVIALFELSPAHEGAWGPWFERWPASGRLVRDDNFGIGLLSRLDTKLEQVQIEKIFALKATIQLEDGPITLFAVHAPPPLNEALIRQQRRVFTEIDAWAATTTGPMVVVGDLNTTRNTASWPRLTAKLRDGFGACGGGWMPTWPAGGLTQLIRIDHALLSPEVGCKSIGTFQAIGTDHSGFVIEVGRR